MRSIATLLLRVTVGGLLVGHGAQKLFGSLDGPGPEGFGEMLESQDLRPGRSWALVAGVSEFGGGLLTVLGAFNPIGPVMALGSMLMATLTVHEGKPVWVTAGGAELPITNMAVEGALILAGPGALSLDSLLGIRVPRWLGAATIFSMIGGVLYGLSTRAQEKAEHLSTAGATPAAPSRREAAPEAKRTKVAA
jgi:putative oxidoreductase